MSELTPLEVTLELPASELLDHDNGLYVRCPLTRTWVPLTDYYSEVPGSLLPLVGKASYEEAPEAWDVVTELVKDPETGENVVKPILDANNQPVMRKVAKENPIKWSEVVRILPAVAEASPEGGTLQVGASDGVGTGEKF